ncbi:MAG: hypothetical protein AAF757_01585 [Cyanobacteria bacterium P01_D01_bin.116]
MTVIKNSQPQYCSDKERIREDKLRRQGAEGKGRTVAHETLSTSAPFTHLSPSAPQQHSFSLNRVVLQSALHVVSAWGTSKNIPKKRSD